MHFKDSLYLHLFNLLPQFGPARLFKVANYFSSFEKAYFADFSELTKAGLETDLVKTFIEHRTKIDPPKEHDKLLKEHINILSYKDEEYPKLLLEIPKLPPLFYYRGQLQNSEELCVGVVGSRKITTYGLSVIPDLVGPLVEAGITIVSGMAFGVDSEAHKQATKKGRRTIAVLGGGLDDKSLYPKHHQLLAQEILDNGGMLISEYPIGTPNFKQNFVARNRIISGLSVATLVVECDLESGSLITAKHALDQNRTVLAVPGPIYADQSRGPNNLIKMGAKPVTEARDIFEELNLQTYPEERTVQTEFGDTPAETAILKLLSKEPVNINSLVKASGLRAGDAASALTMLEMKGRIRNLGGQQYILSR